MKNTIKLKNLDEILEHIRKEGFATDGCDCGDWGYSVSEELHLYAHRGCKRSYNTPDNKWWHVNEIGLYKWMDKGYREWDGKMIVDFVEVDEEDEILDFELCKDQSMILIDELRSVSYERCGIEFKTRK